MRVRERKNWFDCDGEMRIVVVVVVAKFGNIFLLVSLNFELKLANSFVCYMLQCSSMIMKPNRQLSIERAQIGKLKAQNPRRE